MHDFWPLLFWLLMALALIGGLLNWPATGTPNGWRPVSYSLLLWVLLAILGAYAIGAPGLPGR